MVQTLIAAAVAPLLTAAATVAARRGGARLGGIVSAFPAIVGPVLLIVALQHGPAFSARAADGTLLGLVGLAGFSLAYGRAAAAGRAWPVSLAAGWAAAAVTSSLTGALAGGAPAPVGLLLAISSLALAERLLGRGPGAEARPAAVPRAQTPIAVRMGLTAMLVLVLSAAAGALGPLAGGLLAAVPVLASILAVLTHRDNGPGAAAALLRGMLAGMAGFVAFCEVVAVLLPHVPIGATFVAATGAALLLHAAAAATRPRRPTAASDAVGG